MPPSPLGAGVTKDYGAARGRLTRVTVTLVPASPSVARAASAGQLVFSAGDIVTYKQREDADAPRGRVLQRLRDAGGERMWLVAWERPERGLQRLSEPERGLRRFGSRGVSTPDDDANG
jgi:hypothetical protein